MAKQRKLPQAGGPIGLEGLSVLVGLGLSECQARVYLALLRAGDVGARAVACAAGVARQEAYRLLLELQRLGLARKNLTAPTTFAAVPFIDAAKTLFEAKAKDLAAKLSPMPSASVSACFGTVVEGGHGRQYQAALAEVQGVVEGVFSWVRFGQFSFCFEAELKAALKRDVALRFVVEKPAGCAVPGWMGRLPRYRFELKTLSCPPEAALIVFDRAKAAVAFDRKLGFSRGIDLWTAHPALVAACQAYFYRAWGSAQR